MSRHWPTGFSLEWLWTSPTGWLGMTQQTDQQLYLPAPVLANHGQVITLRVNGSYTSTKSGASGELNECTNVRMYE